MADQRKVLRGLEILMSYKPNGSTWNVDAQHDELFAQGRPPSEMSGEDVKELEGLGWNWTGEGSWRRFT